VQIIKLELERGADVSVLWHRYLGINRKSVPCNFFASVGGRRRREAAPWATVLTVASVTAASPVAAVRTMKSHAQPAARHTKALRGTVLPDAPGTAGIPLAACSASKPRAFGPTKLARAPLGAHLVCAPYPAKVPAAVGGAARAAAHATARQSAASHRAERRVAAERVNVVRLARRSGWLVDRSGIAVVVIVIPKKESVFWPAGGASGCNGGCRHGNAHCHRCQRCSK
jgi:hypothetical protein